MMKRYLVVLFCFALLIAPGVLQAQAPSGMTVTCDDGTSFDNGVEIVVSQMRSGFNYTATAIGINGFDPVLAVLNTNTGEGLCSDDDASAKRYDANLPTTGNVPASNLSAQITFSQNITNTFADVSLVVGGYGNQSGEFVLILEGMAVTSGDGAGDMFKVNVTPGMVASGVPLSVYMITRGQSTVDPLMYVADDDFNALADSNGDYFYCDDAGSSDYCYTPVDISNSTITIGSGTLWTWEKDAALILDVSNYPLDSNPVNNYLDYVMTSYKQETEGQYLLAFHVGTTENVPQQGIQGTQGTAPTGGNQTGGNSSGGATGGQESHGG